MKVCLIGSKGRVAQRHKKAWDELGIKWVGFDKGDKPNLKDFDVIDICTPPYLHAKMILQAVIAKVPVICEKPLARTVEEAEKLLGFKHKIGIIFQYRFNPKILKLKREIEAGKYGQIKMVTSAYYRWRGAEYYKSWEPKKELAGGGTVSNVTIHYLDLMQWIFGEPLEVYGFANTTKDIEVEDNAVAIMRFPNDVIGSYVVTSNGNPSIHYEFSVYGTKGHKTIQLRQNEYHKDNLKAFIENGAYVTPQEAIKSLKIAEKIING